MKQTKKLFSIVLAIALVFAMAIPAFAAETTGKITITNAVEGHTYTAYKMLNFAPTAEDANKGVYTIADGWDAFFAEGAKGAEYFDVADKKVTLKTDKTPDADLAKAAVAYAKANSVAATTPVTADGETVEFANLALGYYAVDTTVGMICSLTNTNSTITSVEKNATPALEKKIVEGADRVDTNTAKIGDTVTYEAKITIGKGVVDYVMHDKMSAGLTFGEVVSVKVGDADVAAKNYTVKTTDIDADCDFEIVFDNDYTAGLAKDTVVTVTYTATLNNSAVVGSTGNPNEAWLEYDEDNTVEGTTTTTPDKVITYTAKLTVDKVDDKTPAQPLEGAGFTLYIWDATIDADETTEGIEGDWKIVSEIGAATGRTTFEWKGLDEGKYKLEETTVPAGYNKAADIEFTIDATLQETVVDGTETATWEDTKNADVTVNDGAYATKVVNSTGSLLPETGGMGTTMFYMVGAMMVAAAVVLFVSKKRMAFEA